MEINRFMKDVVSVSCVPSLIGISGYIGSGKDTAGDIMKDILGEGWEVKKFAGKLKKIASILTGIPVKRFEDQDFKKSLLGPEWGNVTTNTALNFVEPFENVQFNELMSVRELLQRLGTEAMRDGLHKNTWVNALFADANSRSKWIITDLRFKNEFEAIKKRGGVTIRILRDNRSKATHSSEKDLDNANFDYYINNNGSIDDLREEIKLILSLEGFVI